MWQEEFEVQLARIPDDTIPEVEYSDDTSGSEANSGECTSCSEDLERDMMPKQIRDKKVQVSAVV